MSSITLFAAVAAGLLLTGMFVWLLVLVIRALQKYIRSEPARSEAAAVKRSLGETIRARRTASIFPTACRSMCWSCPA